MNEKEREKLFWKNLTKDIHRLVLNIVDFAQFLSIVDEAGDLRCSVSL